MSKYYPDWKKYLVYLKYVYKQYIVNTGFDRIITKDLLEEGSAKAFKALPDEKLRLPRLSPKLA